MILFHSNVSLCEDDTTLILLYFSCTTNIFILIATIDLHFCNEMNLLTPLMFLMGYSFPDLFINI